MRSCRTWLGFGLVPMALLSSTSPALTQHVAGPADDLRVARPAYSTRGPRVLFDAAHHNVHTSDGRYKRFADLISADGYQVIPNQRPFDAGHLSHASILVIVSALGADREVDPAASGRAAFTSAECDSVEMWVSRGGSLLLIVDHEPTGAANAELARRFGVQLRDGTAMDPDSAHHWAGCLGCLRFTRTNGLLRTHPITSGRDSLERVRGAVSAAGQSVSGPSASFTFLLLGARAFDVLASGDTVLSGGRAQGLALTFGAGRVVVLGEAAMLAGQAADRPTSPFRRWWAQEPGIDNRQLALNVMHWLSRLLPATP